MPVRTVNNILRRLPGRWVVVAWLAAASVGAAASAGAQPVLPAPAPANVLYVTPWWSGFESASDGAVELEVERLRQLLPDRLYARAGFSVTVEVRIPVWQLDVTDAAQVDSNLAPVFAHIDFLLARAERLGIPLVIGIQTVTRPFWWSDGAHAAMQAEDRRNVQWHADNSIANQWKTPSRYARKLRVFLEAHLRALGGHLARKAQQYPDTLVAAAGDAEFELSFLRSPIASFLGYSESDTLLADYSPFAILEFRDWLRRTGMYDETTGVFAGEGYQGRDYGGDLSPAIDTNGDGHTFNGDFGTAFESWELKYFHWSLTDPDDTATTGDAINDDPGAIPEALFGAVGWNPLPSAGVDYRANGFDAPRAIDRDSAFWQAWHLFRQTMVRNYCGDFARWITTSTDPVTGATFPADRWYTYQIPADYLFGSTPATPNLRWDTSASPLWTASVAPYGGVGITTFNLVSGSSVASTAAGAFPAARALSENWGIFEYDPAVPPSAEAWPYQADALLLEAYRPHVVVPFGWRLSPYPIDETPFVAALAGVMANVGAIPHPASTLDGFAPPPPRGLRVRAQGGSVVATWSALMWPSEPLSGWTTWAGFDQFELHRGASADFTPSLATRVGAATGPTASDTSLSDPGRYCYRVVVWSQSGLSSAASDAACVTWPGGTPQDFDGDGIRDLTVFRPSIGAWFIRHSGGGAVGIAWGAEGDVPVPADYDGDGFEDVAVFRPADGGWYIVRTSGGAASVAWGAAGDVPVPADYDGDGLTDVAVFRPSDGGWYIVRSRDGSVGFRWGSPGDIPVPADYDGDGRADVAVFRPSDGGWYVLRSSGGAIGLAWGEAGDVPVPADYDGDGRADVGIFRPADSAWYIINSSGGAIGFRWGTAGDEAVPGDYDGDGRADVAVFRGSDGGWYILRSSGGATGIAWGTAGDVPL